jgi:outer membrane lipoprotein-sorting protein
MKRVNIFLLIILLGGVQSADSQTALELLQKVKEKFDKINDYRAKGKMKMNVAFIKAPVASIVVHFKKPDQIRITNEKGISLIPKGAVNISIGSVLANTSVYDVIDAGKEPKTNLRIVKMLPRDELSDIVLATFYIDEKEFLVKKAKTTTRENGTYELEMTYAKYAEYGLADKIVFSFNTKDYKLPKGVTFDYDDGTKSANAGDKLKDRKGKVEITYTEYQLNKGLGDSIFNKKTVQ